MACGSSPLKIRERKPQPQAASAMTPESSAERMNMGGRETWQRGPIRGSRACADGGCRLIRVFSSVSILCSAAVIRRSSIRVTDRSPSGGRPPSIPVCMSGSFIWPTCLFGQVLLLLVRSPRLLLGRVTHKSSGLRKLRVVRRVAGEIRVEVPLVGRSFLLAGKSSHVRRDIPLHGDGGARLIGIRIPLLISGAAAAASEKLSQTSKTLSMRLAKN